MTIKKCRICKITKEVSGFYKDEYSNDLLRGECIECSKEKVRQYRRTNPEKVNESNRKWRIKNPTNISASNKKWRSNNKERVKQIIKKWNSKRKDDPKFKIGKSMSRGMWGTLKRGVKENRHWEELVGYTVEHLKRHIEKLFKPGMTWDNYGKVWHIDHKIPIAVFNFEKPEDIDFRLCWSLKNLQPLEAKKNILKRDKIYKPFQPSLLLEAM